MALTVWKSINCFTCTCCFSMKTTFKIAIPRRNWNIKVRYLPMIVQPQWIIWKPFSHDKTFKWTVSICRAFSWKCSAHWHRRSWPKTASTIIHWSKWPVVPISRSTPTNWIDSSISVCVCLKWKRWNFSCRSCTKWSKSIQLRAKLSFEIYCFREKSSESKSCGNRRWPIRF